MERVENKAIINFLKKYEIVEGSFTFSIIKRDAEKFNAALGDTRIKKGVAVVWLEK